MLRIGSLQMQQPLPGGRAVLVDIDPDFLAGDVFSDLGAGPWILRFTCAVLVYVRCVGLRALCWLACAGLVGSKTNTPHPEPDISVLRWLLT